MSKHAGMRKALAATFAAVMALCFAGCSNSDSDDEWDGDIDLVGDLSYQDIAPLVTTTNETVTDVPTNPADYQIKFKDTYETCYQTDTMMYAVSFEDEVVEVDKRDGSYRILYTAQYGSVDILTCSDRVGDEEARLVYVNDGDYIVQIDKNTA